MEQKEIKKETKKKAPNVKPKTDKELAWERDHRMVTGRFTNHEAPGSFIKFPYVKYPGDTNKHYTLWDGEVATIPYMVAEHLNNKCVYKINKYAVDEQGRRSHKIGRIEKRFTFVPLDPFEAQIQPKPNILTVERTA